MTTGIPTKFVTGRVFLPEDNLGIGQGVWDNTHPIRHRFGVGSGGVNPRWYPSVDTTGNMFLNYNTLIKSEYDGYGDHGFGFEGTDFVVRMNGTVVLRLNTLGAQLNGALTQTAADPEYLPSHSGLAELLFPLFTDKTLIAQFNRPAVAGIDATNKFRAYRDINTFLVDFNSTFIRGGNSDVGLVRFVDYLGNYSQILGSQPRIQYGSRTKKCLGLLIEPAATNLITQSFNFPAWSGSTGITFTQENNAIWATKGLNRPFYFIETSNSGEHSGSQPFSSDVTLPTSVSFFYQARSFTGTRRFTLFVSNSDRSHIFGITLDATSNGAPIFNSNRVVGNGVLSNYEIEDIGNGIYRIKITGVINPVGATGSSSNVLTIASLGDTSGNSNLSFTPGPNTGNWCLWGDAQVEQNPFCTTYIQTANSTMTRGADILSLNLTNFRYSNIDGIFNIKFRANPNIKQDTVIFSLQSNDKTTRIDYYIAAINTSAGTFTIGTKQYQPSTTTVVNTNYATLNIARSDLTIAYSNILQGLTRAVISGETGLRATVSLLSYE
jgi:hypothetical protein